MNGTCNGTIFWVCASCGLGGGWGAKGQISLSLNYKVNFKDFLILALCVFSQMKDIKHIRREFHSVPWVMHAPGFGTWG